MPSAAVFHLQVRDKQECLRACMEDLANLTDHFNTVRAAKELSQKELAKIKRQVEEARHDWTRKIRERRAEVRSLLHQLDLAVQQPPACCSNTQPGSARLWLPTHDDQSA